MQFPIKWTDGWIWQGIGHVYVWDDPRGDAGKIVTKKHNNVEWN